MEEEPEKKMMTRVDISEPMPHGQGASMIGRPASSIQQTRAPGAGGELSALLDLLLHSPSKSIFVVQSSDGHGGVATMGE